MIRSIYLVLCWAVCFHFHRLERMGMSHARQCEFSSKTILMIECSEVMNLRFTIGEGYIVRLLGKKNCG